MPVQTWIFMSHYNIENDKAVFKNVSVNANVMSISIIEIDITFALTLTFLNTALSFSIL
jgi:hypothetical protein